MKKAQVTFTQPGLIRTTLPETRQVNGAQRAALIRRGNEFFNAGNMEQAKRIFLTTRYTDGLVRLGDHYYKQHDFLAALQMYVIAPNSKKKEYLIKKMAGIVQQWLAEAVSSDTM